MTVGRHTEISSSSNISLDDALDKSINEAATKLQNVSSLWGSNSEQPGEKATVKEYRVRIEVTFLLNDQE